MILLKLLLGKSIFYVMCVVDSNSHALSKFVVLEKSLLDLQQQVHALTRSVNAHVLSLRDELSRVQHASQGSSDLSAALAPIYDSLNTLD